MTKSSPLVFFGSGPVAAKTLSFVLENFDVSDVITKPRPAHGHQSTPPVEELANKYGVRLHTPVNKAELATVMETKNLPNQLGLVVDYGLIIPQSVIDYFEMGIVNSHFSLLPLWRGADPITFPILNGDKETGVSLMLIVAAMDEGPLLTQESLPIAEKETVISLEERLIKLNNLLLLETLPKYLSNEIELYQQDPDINPTYSRKLTKEDGLIDWNKPAIELEREVRAFQVWPKSFTKIFEKDVILTEVEVIPEQGKASGIADYTDRLVVYCKTDALLISKLKVAGKNETSGREFLSGYGKK